MIEIRNLSVTLGLFQIRDVTLTVSDGEYMVLLGPSGAGKTVLLESIVGLQRKHTGAIIVDGTDVTRLFPEERNIGYVPQDYAIFPNMTVARNLAYGLRARRVPRDLIAERTAGMMAKLGIEQLAERFPGTLSGGEKQRVALGRALLPEPRVLLLDEPLAALDESTRSGLALGLREIQRSVGGTFVHVCHNLEEALDVADRIAIIAEGAIVQVGTPDEILYRPSCLFVARFTRTRNLLPGRARLADGGAQVALDGGGLLHSNLAVDGRVVVSVRPERVRVRHGEGLAGGGMVGRLSRVHAKPGHVEAEVDIGSLVVAYLGHGEAHGLPALGEPVALDIAPEDVRLHTP